MIKKCNTRNRNLINKNQNVFNFFILAKDFFINFMGSSSIHGFNHVIAKERHPIEHILWILTVITASTITIQMSLSKWQRYQENPTVISVERNYLEWNTSLPAVSICPETKYDYNLLSEVVNDKNSNFSELKSTDYWRAIAMIQRQDNVGVITSNNDFEINENQQFFSESGVCYSFNSVVTQYNGPRYWETNNISAVHILPVFLGNPLDGDMFVQIMDLSYGFTLFIHGPAEFPDISSSSLFTLNNTFKELDIQTVTIYSTDEVLQLGVKQRKCRLPEESDLKLSPVYSYNMCRMECRMKKSKELCGCVPFFYKPLKNYKVCDVKGMECLNSYKELLIQLRDPKTEKKIVCNCLPQCNEVNYIIDNDSTMDWSFQTTLKWGIIKYPRVRYKRDILFGWTDLLVAIGGTAGLFLGCSLLSFAEILYFFSLRLFWFVCRRRY